LTGRGIQEERKKNTVDKGAGEGGSGGPRAACRKAACSGFAAAALVGRLWSRDSRAPLIISDEA